MNAALANVLLLLSNALLAPIMLLLVALAAFSAVLLGGLLREAWDRRRRRPAFHAFVCRLKANPRSPVRLDDVPARFGFPARAIRHVRPGSAEKELDDVRLAMDRAQAPAALGIRLGPMLGLMGTLIPLGPALLAMSGGDVQALTANLVVAFATTVVGLLVGGLHFAIHAVRHHWYAQDLNDLEFILGRWEARP